MRSAVPLFRTPAAPWAMMRSPRRTAATVPKRSAPLPSIDCRMASTLTGALFSSDEPAGLDRSHFDASIIFYRGRIGLRTGRIWPTAQSFHFLGPKTQADQSPAGIINGDGQRGQPDQDRLPIDLAFHRLF